MFRSSDSPLNAYRSQDTRTDMAFKQILLSLLNDMEAVEGGVIAGTDTECLHDFRVAVRRSRVLLDQVDGVFPKKVLERFIPGLKWLGLITGPVRDIQVYRLKFNDYQKLLPSSRRQQLEPLYLFLEKREQQEQRELVRHLRSNRYMRFRREWRNYLQAAVPERTTLSHARQPVGQTADKVIWKAYRKVIKRGSRISIKSAYEKFHRLRIQCKRLRYLLEFFQDQYPAGEVRALIQSLKRLQDILGDLNDYVVQADSLPQLERQMAAEGLLSRDTQKAMRMLERCFRGRMRKQRELFAVGYRPFASRKNHVLFGRLCNKTQEKG